MDKAIDFSGESYILEYQNIKYKGPYFHRHALELLFVVSGEILIDIEGETTLLKEGNFICVNAGLTHMIQGDEKSFVSSLYFDLQHFEKKYPFIRGINFYCKYTKATSTDIEQYHALRNYFIRLMMIEYLKIPRHNSIGEDICEIMLNILIDYIYDEVFVKNRLSDLKPQDRERILSITKYKSDNYNKKGFSLIQVAENEHLSPTRLSHFWKSMINISFMDAVNMGRFMEAKRLLLEGEKSIGTIVEECGFSDEKYLYKMIRERYDMTPAEFRKRHREIISKPGEYKIWDIVEVQNVIFDYSSNYYNKLNEFAYLREELDRAEEEKKINYLYSVITSTNKKKINDEEIEDKHVVLKLGLNSGLRYVGNKIVINWEYIYAIGQITIILFDNCSILLDIETMSVDEWQRILRQIKSKVNELWNSDFNSSTSLIIAYRDNKNYYKAKNLADIVNDAGYFVKAKPILYI